jgi:hypothetical protein
MFLPRVMGRKKIQYMMDEQTYIGSAKPRD